MTVYKINRNSVRISSNKQCLFFPDSESLTRAVLILMKSLKSSGEKSALYALNGRYILILENIPPCIINTVNEFYCYKTDNQIKIESIKEYALSIIENNAITRYGAAFS